MKLSAIAAMASNRVIGQNNQLPPWNLPEDLKFFKETTMGHIMLMGRKTFESLGRPLPKRLHVVVTHQKGYQADGAHVFNSIPEALEFCRQQTAEWGDEVFIIGGGEIFRELLPLTERIYLTEIHEAFDGEAKFPEFSPQEFAETQRSPRYKPRRFDFVIYNRINPSGI